ncbi:carbohydrate esterase family 16 protein [Ceratobasidium sp. AG-Ba]|nr:carbohydrate esterase family 16 protein [Ceratobasidium sp. AG-Ba]QRW08237.1 carbohydrate esterase family 16 protein [Ceratobasidium sp. AG-Ba]
MILQPLALLALVSSCSAFSLKNLVTFGDSYTDNTMNGDAGFRWPDLVSMRSNGSVTVYDFAHSGATCSNRLTPRIYKPVLEAQIPEYTTNVTTKMVANQKTTYIKSKNGTYVPLASKDTMYSIWIGTNDVGIGALLTDPLKDVSIVNTTECVFDWVEQLYNQGARNFLIQNMTPMWLLPMYTPAGFETKYWWGIPRNNTEWSLFIAELVRSGNELQALRTKYIAPGRFPGARFGIFDSFRLFKDIYEKPQDYLVGPTYNVTGVIQTCRYPPGNSTLVCEAEPYAVRNSYMWWNELHPSERVHDIVAQNVIKALKGQGPFVQWYGAK